MSSLTVVKQNIIAFDRMDDINVTGYEVTVKEELQGGEIKEYILATIPNPKTPSLVQVRHEFDYNDKHEFEIRRHKVYYSGNYRINVYINGKKLNDILTYYNETTKTVYLTYKALEPWDRIEIEYYYDGILITHDTQGLCEYTVEPIIDYEKHTVGDHNVLI